MLNLEKKDSSQSKGNSLCLLYLKQIFYIYFYFLEFTLKVLKGETDRQFGNKVITL